MVPQIRSIAYAMAKSLPSHRPSYTQCQQNFNQIECLFLGGKTNRKKLAIWDFNVSGKKGLQYSRSSHHGLAVAMVKAKPLKLLAGKCAKVGL